MNLCIDLCSGLGGLSRAFVDAGWEVITVDIEPKFNPTICADIRQVMKHHIEDFSKYQLKDYDKIVVLASPPCQAFSLAGIPHYWKNGVPSEKVADSLEILTACIRLIAEIKPNQWLLENPRGKLRYLIGKPKTTIKLCDYGAPWRKETDIWGNTNLGLVTNTRQPTNTVINPPKSGNRKPMLTRSAAKRAEMPLGLSQAILKAVTEEKEES